mmetsp:Transcript_50009/g.56595  ORF Transcript_50009/g.56595 Transcript_50009/m.56595 type:complete len:206 (+) Transcript_50009:650-1267(+)
MSSKHSGNNTKKFPTRVKRLCSFVRWWISSMTMVVNSSRKIRMGPGNGYALIRMWHEKRSVIPFGMPNDSRGMKKQNLIRRRRETTRDSTHYHNKLRMMMMYLLFSFRSSRYQVSLTTICYITCHATNASHHIISDTTSYYIIILSDCTVSHTSYHIIAAITTTYHIFVTTVLHNTYLTYILTYIHIIHTIHTKKEGKIIQDKRF